SRGLVGPKSATTAQPKSAERMLPSDREMRARMACRIATVVPRAHAPSHASARTSPDHEVDQGRHEGEGEEEMDRGARDMKRDRPDAQHHDEDNGEQQEHGLSPSVLRGPGRDCAVNSLARAFAVPRLAPIHAGQKMLS